MPRETLEKDTKVQFDVPHAAGVLVIVNEAAVALNSEVVAYKVWQVFGKTKADGTSRYPDVAAVLLLCELHEVHGTKYQKAFPIVTMLGPGAASSATLGADLDGLVMRWATFNNATLINAPSTKDIGWSH